jgi:23S rRNA (adenine2030-N6)-methyltransferase
MNYRHAFHAGNFADVFKHAVLLRMLDHLKQKPAPFAVLDTHAGIGLYDLQGEEALRSPEWREGIGRLWGADPEPTVKAFVAPLLAMVAAENPDDALRFYPGSPRLIRASLRPGDRLLACELHQQDSASLARLFARDRQVRIVALDGWTALNAWIPFKERRGLVLVDPPFEAQAEMDRLVGTLLAARAKWPGAIYCGWFPVKEPGLAESLARHLRESGQTKWLIAEFARARVTGDGPLASNGLMILNPPWTLASELQAALPGLARLISPAQGRATVIAGPD